MDASTIGIAIEKKSNWIAKKQNSFIGRGKEKKIARGPNLFSKIRKKKEDLAKNKANRVIEAA
jgi:hypothetical protein